MSRIHAFEWEDQPWFPTLFRNFLTDYLAFIVSKLYGPTVPMIVETLLRTGCTEIIDLCSGGGGPLCEILPKCRELLGVPVKATLTDLYPNIEAFKEAKASGNGAIDYFEEPINAMSCPKSSNVMRTMFTSLHHFRPDEVKKILSDSAFKRVPICAFETQEKNKFKLIFVPFVVFFGAFILTPFVGRMTLGRFFFTYIFPVTPILLVWDGVVSCLRTYTPKELDNITNSIRCENYKWESGIIPSFGFIGSYNITYLIGVPI